MTRLPTLGTPEERERLRMHLCGLETAIQARVLGHRDTADDPHALAAVDALTEADTIYAIDRVGEEIVLEWLDAHWPEEWPAVLVMEGLEGPVLFPRSGGGNGAGREPRLTCIVDPIDGTRGLMHDKRSAWVLAGIAPFDPRSTGGARPARLCDVEIAAMTELPPSKQRLADQLSGVCGAGARGVRAVRVDVDSRRAHAFRPRPSRATDLLHGFAALARFFPPEKELVARIEAFALDALYGARDDWPGAPLVFDDQYLATGGQFHELLSGRDRMLGDIRPLVYRHLGLDAATACHPYDACTGLLLEELGCVLEKPGGGRLDAPLDLVSPVAWVGYANEALAAHVRPALEAALRAVLGEDALAPDRA